MMMKKTISLPILVLLTLIGAARPAAASTYLFSVPVTTLQTAITAAIAPVNSQLFGFYDIYIRPALADDFVGGNDLPSYTASYDISPIPTGNDRWTASTGTAAGDGSNVSFHFTFNPADTSSPWLRATRTSPARLTKAARASKCPAPTRSRCM